jgi:REP element-mobilizing transposase RayT
MFPGICFHYQYKLIEVNGEAHHIHLLIDAHQLWNSGYFVASTRGVTLETLKKYVENQGCS